MSLWDKDLSGIARASFLERIPDPGTDPETGPFVCVRYNQAWHEAVIGCILQLCQPATWKDMTDVQVLEVLERATKLLNLFGFASSCPMKQDGLQAITILSGDAWGSVFVPFLPVFALVPHVDVSCDDGQVIASFSEEAVDGMIVTITAATPVVDPITAFVSWSAEDA